MRELLRRLSYRARRRRRPRAQVYRSASCPPLLPSQVRNRQFAVSRRGLDPNEVSAFLSRVADDLAGVHAELARSREETTRIRDALRRWQSQQAPAMHELAHR